MLKTLDAYDRVIRSLHGNIRALKIYPKVFTAKEHAYLHPLYDRALFGALSLLDLVVGLKYLSVSEAVGNQFESNYFARVVAHCIYETLRHQNKLAGKDVQELIEARLGAEAAADLNSSTRELSRLRKAEASYFKGIRNDLFGHKLPSGIEQAERILAVDNARVSKVGQQVLSQQIQILASYVNLMGKI